MVRRLNAEHSPHDPLDERDTAVLAEIAAATRTVDPVPEGLAERALFAMTLEALEAELMELSYVAAPAMSVRADAPAVTARTVTFTSDALTIMITLSSTDGDAVRIDGYAAPGGAMRVALHQPGAINATVCDEEGRFSFVGVRRGPSSLVVRNARGAAMLTPVIEI